MNGRQPRLQVSHERERRPRRRVAPVKQRMDVDGRDPASSREISESDQMPVVGMDPTRSDQTDDVECPGRLGRTLTGVEERRSDEECPVGNGAIDTRQILQHGPAGTQVQVAHLGVAHLTGGQPDGVLRCPQDRMGPTRQEAAPGGHRRRGDRVRGWITADPEAIEDDQDDRARTRHRAARRAARRAVAVSPARATMPAISSGLSEAPPTSAPSIVGSARNSAMLAAVTLPP